MSNPFEGEIHKEAMLGHRNVPKGIAHSEIRGRYYDVTHTINNATANDPGDADAQGYDEENVYDTIQRRADKVRVVNDGADDLFVRVSHDGMNTFSPENTIYPGDKKEYYNVYALRLRSPTAGLPYRVSEYNIDRTCCPADISGVDPTWVHGVEVTAPAAGATLVSRLVGSGKTGFLYGFLISAQEANNFYINWISGGVAYRILIVFGGMGSTQDTESIPFNKGLPADAGTNIWITVIGPGSQGVLYQARILYAEV